ncbi:MAG: ferrous iron transport protein A [Mycolicibacterium sp.]|uniref:FeoA family protein n=1 Tax=Mycolicibacterium sp. TaxID=2320850 RepID=UPI003D152D37
MTISRPGLALPQSDLGAGRISLAELAVGTTAEIVSLATHAPAELLARLRHLGFRPGTRITKLRTAPLGDPALYRLLGYDTCLRRRESSYVEVRRDG